MRWSYSFEVARGSTAAGGAVSIEWAFFCFQCMK